MADRGQSPTLLGAPASPAVLGGGVPLNHRMLQTVSGYAQDFQLYLTSRDRDIGYVTGTLPRSALPIGDTFDMEPWEGSASALPIILYLDLRPRLSST